MALIATTIPASAPLDPVITFRDLVAVLPDTIPYGFNVWIGGHMARFGKVAGNLIFLVEMDTEPSVEVRNYFNSIVQPLGIAATASELWRGDTILTVRLYNNGHLIIDRETLTYTELPSTIESLPEITFEWLNSKLPKIIPFQEVIWLTGSIVKNGWSRNDLDLIIGDVAIDEAGNIILSDEIDRPRQREIRNYFTMLIGWKTDVGTRIMSEREPVYLYKLYTEGNRWAP